MHCKVLNGILCLFAFLSFTSLQAHGESVPKDSVGIEKKQGEVFIVHKIEQGETLFSISRLYGVTIDDLKNSNPEMNVDKIGMGDSLKVPLFPELFRGKKTHHTVKEGETLFRISRQYDVSVESIRLWNATGNKPLSVGQELVIYLKDPAEDSIASVKKRYLTHEVKEGETLYAISKSYDVSVDSLKLLNEMEGESLSFGELLLIREKPIDTVAVEVKKVPVPETVASAGKATDKKAGNEKKQEESEDENDDEDELPAVDNKGKRLTRAEALAQEKERVIAIRAEEKKALSEYKKESEIGFAATIPGRSDTQKFLALHRSVPVGTIMQVRNEMNNVSVFVRVVGKLPDTGMNSKLTIRISQAAYEKLGGINERFPVEITYLK